VNPAGRIERLEVSVAEEFFQLSWLIRLPLTFFSFREVRMSEVEKPPDSKKQWSVRRSQSLETRGHESSTSGILWEPKVWIDEPGRIIYVLDQN
jgi:hypothetical protein